ncbi:hypothetical protein DFH01_07505 [Falsiroseomonas bella]|uniref:DUF1835 domain-containing protein n=1 Tax=Falsiroseomonas bella TaxID=2184016 RepID=A0A317FN64_9PROT|nr:hypothetical protein [Falsiroseomonas bella]PWS39076.1 hypothetical protein DFH01_07505 [Falsiroseomonas bella]
MGTAHLRCGDDLRARLPAAGWAGDYLAFADPVCQGPVGADGLMAYLGIRARFVALHYGAALQDVRLRLGAEYAALNGLDRFERVLLWFEHDLWDQAALIRVLGLLAERRALEGRLFLMPADGVRPFAALPDAELAALAPAPLTRAQLEAGALAWEGFAAEDPRTLDGLWRRPSPLPHLSAAMRRHLQDLPWTTDGLALTERLLLQAVAAGASEDGAVLRAMLAADPVFQVTDLIILDLRARLAEGPRRLLERGAAWRLTAQGEAVLRGEARHVPAPRFQGGVTVGPNAPWCWDPRFGGVVEARA